MDTVSQAEFDEEFGASLSAADLERFLQRARESGDRELWLLVKEHQTLRRTAADLLAWIEERDPGMRLDRAEPGSPLSYPVGFLRFLLRDEPRTPTV